MTEILNVVGKFVVIALAAALVAWLPVVALFVIDMDMNLRASFAATTFTFALLGSYGVGFPIAIATFFLACRQLAQSPSILVLIVFLVGAMIALTSLILLDRSAALIFGIPSLLAAATYAGLGWLWILRPLSEKADV